MKTLTLALGALVALIVAAPAMATPTAAVNIDCEGRYAVATFSYTSNANGLTATETISLDGVQKASEIVNFNAPGATDFLSVAITADQKPHTIAASTVVTDSNPNTDDPRATASDSVTCTAPPPPCQVDPTQPKCDEPPPPCASPPCGPPPPDPFCETHPGASICHHNPPPPCEGKECDELPETGAGYVVPLGIFGGFLLLTGGALYWTGRKRGEQS